MEHRWDETRAAALADELEQLIYLSNLVGADATLTQPGGGNSSVKRQESDVAGRRVEVLRVKGSGTDLATISAAGFTGLRLPDLALLGGQGEMTDDQMMTFLRAGMLDGREPAPSVETPLHSVLPYRFIVHTHDFATQALTDTARPAEPRARGAGRGRRVHRLRATRVPAGPRGHPAGATGPPRPGPGAGPARPDRLGRHCPGLLR